MKFLIVGCGAQGRVIAAHMARTPEVEEIRLGDINLEACKQYASFLKSDKVSVFRIDARNVDEIAACAKGVDVIVNATLSLFNLNIMEASLKAGAHYIDLAFGPPYENFERELALSERFERAGLTALTGTGASPGIVNVLAKCAVDELDRVESIIVRLSCVSVSKKPVSTWSPETLIMDSILEPVILKDGVLKTVPPFSGEETYTFPDPLVGTQTLYYHLHEEPFMFSRFIGKGLKDACVKMGGPDIELIKMLWRMGFFSDKEIKVKNFSFSPKEVTPALFPPPPTVEEIREMVETGTLTEIRDIAVVEVIGEREGKRETRTLWFTGPPLKETIKAFPMATPSSYVISTPCWLLAKMLASNEIKTRGVITPELLDRDIRRKFLLEMASQSPPIIVYERIERRMN